MDSGEGKDVEKLFLKLKSLNLQIVFVLLFDQKSPD